MWRDLSLTYDCKHLIQLESYQGYYNCCITVKISLINSILQHQWGILGPFLSLEFYITDMTQLLSIWTSTHICVIMNLIISATIRLLITDHFWYRFLQCAARDLLLFFVLYNCKLYILWTCEDVTSDSIVGIFTVFWDFIDKMINW